MRASSPPPTRTIEERGDLLIRWLRAEIKGWQWHLENPEEMAELMVSTYGQRGLDLEAQTVESRLMADFVPIGGAAENGLLWVDPEVFQQGIDFEIATGGIEDGARHRRGRGHAGPDRRGPRRGLSAMAGVLSGRYLARGDAGRWQAAPGRLSFDENGVSAITPSDDASRTLILPALSNAHDHGRGMRTTAFGAGDDALEVWIAALGREPATDPYLRAAVAFARMAEAGIATLNHCHNSADPARMVQEAEAVSRAARDVGLRVAFAVARHRAQSADLWRSRAALGPFTRAASTGPSHPPGARSLRHGAACHGGGKSRPSSMSCSRCNTAPSARNGWRTRSSNGSPKAPR